MESLVSIRNLSITLGNQTFFRQFSFTFYKSMNTAIIGTSASGKSLLLKAILGTIPYSGTIQIRGKVKVVFPKFHFSSKSVFAYFSYDKLLLEQQKFLMDFISFSLEENPNFLKRSEQCLLVILDAILKSPDALFVDDVFSYLDRKILKKVMQYLKKRKISFYFVTSNMEEVLYAKYLIVLDNYKLAIEGTIPEVFFVEKPLKRLGFPFPFLVELSNSLKYYGIANRIYTRRADLVSMIVQKKQEKGVK